MIDGDAWTCPTCGQTIRGPAQKRRSAQRHHARAQASDRPCPRHRQPPVDLHIPATPAAPRRTR